MITNDEGELAGRAFLLGLARNPLPPLAGLRERVPAESLPLAALVMVSQSARFRRPAAPGALDRPAPFPPDPRRMLPERLRGELLRQLDGDRATLDIVAPAVFRLLRARGVRPHPFDLPRIEEAMRVADDELGPAERAFLERKRPAADSSKTLIFGQAIDDANWIEFPKAERLAFIRARRAADPDAARGLIEAQLGSVAAPVRAELVAVLGLNLRAEDHALLEKLGKDRAPTVRDLARTLLERIPGTPVYAERLARAAAAMTKRRAGLINRRTVLDVTLPGKNREERREAATAVFMGLRLSDLAAALDMTPADAVAALEAAPAEVAVLLARSALGEGDPASAATLAGRAAAEGWPWALAALGDVLDRSRPVAEAAFAAAPLPMLPEAASWVLLGHALGGVLPENLGQALLASRGWRDALREGGSIGRFDAEGRATAVRHPQFHAHAVLGAVAVLPQGALARALRDLDALPPEIAGPAIRYARFAVTLGEKDL